MTVKCLTPEEQSSIAEWYQVVKTPISEIAYIYGVSPRTIARVIHEAGLATPLSKVQGQAYQAMQILKAHHVLVSDLATLLVLGKAALHEVDEELQQDAMAVQIPEFEDMPF